MGKRVRKCSGITTTEPRLSLWHICRYEILFSSFSDEFGHDFALQEEMDRNVGRN